MITIRTGFGDKIPAGVNVTHVSQARRGKTVVVSPRTKDHRKILQFVDCGKRLRPPKPDVSRLLGGLSELSGKVSGSD